MTEEINTVTKQSSGSELLVAAGIVAFALIVLYPLSSLLVQILQYKLQSGI